MSIGSRLVSGLKTGAMGAGAGFIVGGAPGALAGGLGGFGLGAMNDTTGQQEDLNRQAQQNSAEVQQKLAEATRQQYALRMQNLDKAMQYFGPADDAYARLYGTRPNNPNFFSAPSPHVQIAQSPSNAWVPGSFAAASSGNGKDPFAIYKDTPERQAALASLPPGVDPFAVLKNTPKRADALAASATPPVTAPGAIVPQRSKYLQSKFR